MGFVVRLASLMNVELGVGTGAFYRLTGYIPH